MRRHGPRARTSRYPRSRRCGAYGASLQIMVAPSIRLTQHVYPQSDPKMIKEIVDAVTIPVMAKVRIGHFVEAQILQSIGIDYIDESEVLTPADEEFHINKHQFKVPFVCGARNLGEALRRISEGAAFIRTKGEAGTGNVVEAVRHQRAVSSSIRKISVMSEEELYAYAKDIQAPFHLLKETARLKRLPVVNFAAGGVATPEDAALMMQLGCDGVFVGSGIFHVCGTTIARICSSTLLTATCCVVRRPREARKGYCTGCHALQQPEDACRDLRGPW